MGCIAIGLCTAAEPLVNFLFIIEIVIIEIVRPDSIDPMTAVVQRVKAFAYYSLSFSRHNKIKWNTFSYIFYLVISSDSINEKVLMISVHH